MLTPADHFITYHPCMWVWGHKRNKSSNQETSLKNFCVEHWICTFLIEHQLNCKTVKPTHWGIRQSFNTNIFILSYQICNFNIASDLLHISLLNLWAVCLIINYFTCSILPIIQLSVQRTSWETPQLHPPTSKSNHHIPHAVNHQIHHEIRSALYIGIPRLSIPGRF